MTTHGTHLVSAGQPSTIEPMGVYAGKTASLEELADGAAIAVPNDATNEGRALLLLEAQGLIDHPGRQRQSHRHPQRHRRTIPRTWSSLELEAAMIAQHPGGRWTWRSSTPTTPCGAGLNPATDALAI